MDFESIRPFRDDEVPAAIKQLCAVPYFKRVLEFLFPTIPAEDVIGKLQTITTIDDFQKAFILPFLDNLIKKTTQGVTASGLENVDPKKSYLFMTNHRDIILDSALMNVKLSEHGVETTEIGIGDNLLIYEWITDLVKLNKSFVVKRNLPVRQMMEASATLSAFIRQSISEGRNIWISQREGRTKDGDDQTQSSVLKMLNLSSQEDVVKGFEDLHILPVSISYELDPTDYLKAFQFQLKRDNPDYKKSPEDDLIHMNTGLQGRKGRIHFSFGKEITASDMQKLVGLNKNAFINGMCELVDHQVHKNYHLWSGNYVAYDWLNKTNIKADEGKYTPYEQTTFMEYVNEHISRLGDAADRDFVLTQILQMYATPVVNKEKAETI